MQKAWPPKTRNQTKFPSHDHSHSVVRGNGLGGLKVGYVFEIVVEVIIAVIDNGTGGT